MFPASIITIGDELLIGQTIDTNSAFIAQELNKLGIWVRRRVAVGDVADEIRSALDEEGKSSKLVILTGGLGPTADDITKPTLCAYFDGKMVVNEEVRQHVIYLFEKVYRRPGPILERNLKQAEVPDTATVLHNARGSAPGMWFEKNGTLFISLPGVPHEMKGIMLEEVLPRLTNHYQLPAIVHRTAFTMGAGESIIAEKLVEFETALPTHIKLAYLPDYGSVRLRLTATGESIDSVQQEVDGYFKQLTDQVTEYLVSEEDERLENVIGNILRRQDKTLGTAESCTGGFIAHLITRVAGSSEYFKGTVVSYANETKMNLLGVKKDTLEKHGAVSRETVIEMAKGAMKALNTDYAVATSGIMGPGGGTAEKPVGLVWVAVASRDGVESQKINLRFDRQGNIRYAASQALNLLRKFMLTNS